MRVIYTSNTRGHIDAEAQAYIDQLDDFDDGATLQFLATTTHGPFVVKWTNGPIHVRGESARSLVVALKAVVDQVNLRPS